ncbi:hypothetical protein [Parapedobacter sp. 2B3]|uniref:hypothetical protein n=1 Tax=Parapedobacter sp. 2B3 TaxID=3342381 RepID=UPI0035B5D4D2
MTRHLSLFVRLFRRFPLEKLEYALDLYIQSTEQHLLKPAGTAPETETLAAAEQAAESLPDEPIEKKIYEECELMTVKEAMDFIPAGRTKIYEWRIQGILHTIERSSRSKRLIRAEVEHMRTWARNKGKR